jgi:hypothetical protein
VRVNLSALSDTRGSMATWQTFKKRLKALKAFVVKTPEFNERFFVIVNT